MDTFFQVVKCQYEDQKRAKLKVVWCVQGVHSWWFAVHDKVTITADQFNNWKPYQPKGDLRL